MDVELARTFLEIVRARSFARAAEQLDSSQTAVSARIRNLEQQLGRPLFIRNKNGASLTGAGERFRCATRRCWCSCGNELDIRSLCRQVAARF